MVRPHDRRLDLIRRFADLLRDDPRHAAIVAEADALVRGPAPIPPEQVMAALRQHGSVAAAARALGVPRSRIDPVVRRSRLLEFRDRRERPGGDGPA